MGLCPLTSPGLSIGQQISQVTCCALVGGKRPRSWGRLREVMEGCLEEQSQEDLQWVTWVGERRTPWPGGLKSEGLEVGMGQGAAFLSMSSWQNSTLPKAGLQHGPSRGFC